MVPTGIDDELAEEFFGSGVNDPDMEILDQEDDGARGWVRPTPMWWSFPPTSSRR
jgi:hypothetical protein